MADAAPVIAYFKLRARGTSVADAVGFAVEKGWLGVDGATYVLTKVGAKLGLQSKSRPKTRRVLPF